MSNGRKASAPLSVSPGSTSAESGARAESQPSPFEPFSPDPFNFNPDDKKTYLLMVFSRQPFVPFAISASTAGWKKNPVFPRATGIYALYLNDKPLSQVLTAPELTTPLSGPAFAKLNLSLVYIGKTSSGGTVNGRLNTHYAKISKRQNISVDRVV